MDAGTASEKITVWSRMVNWCKRAWQERRERRQRWNVAQFVLKSMRDQSIGEEARRAITELSLFGSWVESRFSGKAVDANHMVHEGYLVSAHNAEAEIVHVRLWTDFRRAAIRAHAEGAWELQYSPKRAPCSTGLFGLHARLTKLPHLDGRPDFSMMVDAAEQETQP